MFFRVAHRRSLTPLQSSSKLIQRCFAEKNVCAANFACHQTQHNRNGNINLSWEKIRRPGEWLVTFIVATFNFNYVAPKLKSLCLLYRQHLNTFCRFYVFFFNYLLLTGVRPAGKLDLSFSLQLFFFDWSAAALCELGIWSRFCCNVSAKKKRYDFNKHAKMSRKTEEFSNFPHCNASFASNSIITGYHWRHLAARISLFARNHQQVVWSSTQFAFYIFTN